MIKFVGKDLTIAENLLPDGGLKLTEGLDTLDVKWQHIFGLVVLIFMFMLIVCNKNKIRYLVKEEKEKLNNEAKKRTKIQNVLYGYKIIFKIFIICLIPVLIAPVHEFIHAVLFGGNVEIGFMSGYMIVSPLDTISKLQSIIAALAPIIILAIIPFVIVNILLHKNKMKITKYLMIVLFSIIMLFSAAPDLIFAYNIIKYIPNGSIIQQIDGEIYYYRE